MNAKADVIMLPSTQTIFENSALAACTWTEHLVCSKVSTNWVRSGYLASLPWFRAYQDARQTLIIQPRACNICSELQSVLPYCWVFIFPQRCRSTVLTPRIPAEFTYATYDVRQDIMQELHN